MMSRTDMFTILLQWFDHYQMYLQQHAQKLIYLCDGHHVGMNLSSWHLCSLIKLE